MKKALITLLVAGVAATVTAGQIVEAIVVRVGDRVVTRTQYDKRLHDGYTEIEQTAAPADVAAKKAEFKGHLINDLISELLIKDRADRLGLTVTQDDLTNATDELKKQYG